MRYKVRVTSGRVSYAMKQFIRSLFWPGKVIADRIPEIQKEIDAEHGIKPAPIFKPDFYRRLSEASHVQV